MNAPDLLRDVLYWEYKGPSENATMEQCPTKTKQGARMCITRKTNPPSYSSPLHKQSFEGAGYGGSLHNPQSLVNCASYQNKAAPHLEVIRKMTVGRNTSSSTHVFLHSSESNSTSLLIKVLALEAAAVQWHWQTWWLPTSFYKPPKDRTSS